MKSQDEFPIDHSKLNKEDRRFLLQFFTEQTKWNANNMLSSLAICLSVISLMVSSLTLLYAVEGKVSSLVLGLGILYSFFFILATINFYKTRRLFRRLAKTADEHYKRIFKLHFAYAKEGNGEN